MIPIRVDKNSLEGYDRLTSTIKAVKEDSNPSLKILGLFLVEYQSNTSFDKDMYKQCLEGFKDIFLPVTIRKSVEIREAPLYNVPINIYKPKSNGALDYKNLVNTILVRLERI